MMSHALELFTAVPKKHNCAQAVASGCGHDELYGPLQACGGGRAPNGLCGALHAAMLLSPDKAEEILNDFRTQLGASQCAVLKQELHVPCTECVKLGAVLAEQYKK